MPLWIVFTLGGLLMGFLAAGAYSTYPRHRALFAPLPYRRRQLAGDPGDEDDAAENDDISGDFHC